MCASQARRFALNYKARMREPIACTSLPSFLEEAARAGIGSVVVRAIHEIRPRHLPGHAVEVGPQRWVELAGYAKGTLVTARLDGADADEVARTLEGRGLTVKRTSGNIT